MVGVAHHGNQHIQKKYVHNNHKYYKHHFNKVTIIDFIEFRQLKDFDLIIKSISNFKNITKLYSSLEIKM